MTPRTIALSNRDVTTMPLTWWRPSPIRIHELEEALRIRPGEPSCIVTLEDLRRSLN